MDKLCRRDDPGEHHLTPILLWRLPALNNFTPTKIHDTLRGVKPIAIPPTLRNLERFSRSTFYHGVRTVTNSIRRPRIYVYARSIIRLEDNNTCSKIFWLKRSKFYYNIYCYRAVSLVNTHTYNRYTGILTIALTTQKINPVSRAIRANFTTGIPKPTILHPRNNNKV